MRQAQMNDVGADAAKKLLALAMEGDVGGARFLVANFDILPAERGTDACSEGLRNGLFGCETRRDEWSWILMSHAVSKFIRDENSIHEPVTKAFPGILYALNLHQINTDADDHGDM